MVRPEALCTNPYLSGVHEKKSVIEQIRLGSKACLSDQPKAKTD